MGVSQSEFRALWGKGPNKLERRVVRGSMCNRAVKARRTARSTGYAYDDLRHFGARIGVFYPEGVPEVRLKVRTNSGVKVLIGQKHWSVRSGRQLGRRETGWRAAGSERPVHKQDNDGLDSA